MNTDYKYLYSKYKHKYLVAKAIYDIQYGGLLKPAIIAFIKELPDLQQKAEERNDTSFQKISPEYLNDLQSLVDKERTFKTEIKSLNLEQKKKKEEELNLFGDELKTNPEWNRFMAMKDIFYKMPNQTQWIITNYKNGSISKVSDIESHIFPLIKEFLKLKIKQMPNTVENLEAKLQESKGQIESIKDIEEKNKIAREGGETIYASKNIKIIKLLTEEGSCYYGKGTKWCTAYTEIPNKFKLHDQYGIMYIVQPIIRQTSNVNEKYQLQFPRADNSIYKTMFEFKDDKNEDIPLVDIYKMYPEIRILKNVYGFLNIILFGAISKDSYDATVMILDDGANPNERNLIDLPSWTPLYQAVLKNNKQIIQLLLDRGADINEISGYEAPIHAAARNGFTDALGVLLENNKLNINLQDDRGNTPLHSLIRSGTNNEYIPIIIKKGANLSIKNQNGETPYDLAKIYGMNDDTLKMLRQ